MYLNARSYSTIVMTSGLDSLVHSHSPSQFQINTIGCRLTVLTSDQIHHTFYSMHLSSLIPLVSFAYCARAQTPTSSYVEPTVPTGTPIPGNYNGALRPQIHYSPPIDFMVGQCRPTPEPGPNLNFPRDSFHAVGRMIGIFKSQSAKLLLGTLSDGAIERSQWYVLRRKRHLPPVLSV